MSCTGQTPNNRPYNTTTPSTTAGGSIPTLSEFLRSCKLSQYYNEFLASGAGEDDVPMLLDFADSEITELCAAISLKPFHIVSLKRGIRMLKEQLGLIPPQVIHTAASPPLPTAHPAPVVPIFSNIAPTPPNATFPGHMNPTAHALSPKIAPRVLPDVVTVIPDTRTSEYSAPSVASNNGLERTSLPNKALIIERATIYGRKSGRELTKYERSMNDAAIGIALAEPTLILNRGLLIEKSKAKLLQDGYVYSRGRSRSKLVRTISSSVGGHESPAINGNITPAPSDMGYREEDSSSTSDKEHQAVMSGKTHSRESRERDEEEDDDAKNKNKKLKFEKENEKDLDNKERDPSLRDPLHGEDK
ncbi:hypothetical protein K493DRAFT_337819 [Basidiobolus meristosporus CBS 931.73]|uniref:SAM domain-containing protein n=1 Tax=Basidiobolus meristosporus CBS 931.73 TaxID=1314790 RepID=A0A1Y1Y8N4_9FUNG|nr:hypothetical protein K493DRAFT_337819 [Basidiobolus meristosporus CBS 931.73]|eukprot:ORX94372.1 hypothetical protein K493DRAFT_337819 [Basidiobolus meristosporus CBS 931.73]